jgi:DNA-binding HxlR family transcriptional regulator
MVMTLTFERRQLVDKKAPAGNPSPARPNPIPGCPMAAAFAAIGGKWKLTLLYWLAHDESHFAGLRRRAAPITPKVLAEQLRQLEADGLVARLENGPVPAPVIYRLTPYGSTVLPVVESVRVWGEKHLDRVGGRAAPSSAMACAEPLDQPAVRIAAITG